MRIVDNTDATIKTLAKVIFPVFGSLQPSESTANVCIAIARALNNVSEDANGG